MPCHSGTVSVETNRKQKGCSPPALISENQRGTFEYDLFLRNDLNTTGHTQWFFFAVSDTHQGVHDCARGPIEIKFNIVNLTKPDSLFSRGMQPVRCIAELRTFQAAIVASSPDVFEYCGDRSCTRVQTLTITRVAGFDPARKSPTARKYPRKASTATILEWMIRV